MCSSSRAKRLLREFKILIKDPHVQSYFYYESSKKDENSERLHIYGYLLPQTIPYKYGSYKVHITIPINYPFKSPEIKLLTYIYHPAVHRFVEAPSFCRGCCNKQWSPVYRIDKCIELMVYAIDHPEDDGAYCVMDQEAKTLFQQNRVQYEEKALAMVKKYSCPLPNPSIVSLKFAVKQMICKQLYFDSEKLNQLPLSNRLKEYLHS